MFVNIRAEELSIAIKKLLFCCRANTFAITKCVVLEAFNTTLKAISTNLDMTLLFELDCDVKEEGVIVVDAQSIFNAASKLPKDDIMSLKTNKSTLEIKSGRYKLMLPTCDESEFPPVHDIFNDITWNLRIDNSDNFHNSIAKTLISISTDKSRAEFNGTLFKLTDENLLTLCSTDGHRLSLTSMIVDNINENNDMLNGFIVPIQACQYMAKEFEGTIKLAVCKGKLVISDGVLSMCTSLISGTFPNFEMVIPAEDCIQYSALVHKDNLNAVIKRVIDFSSKSKSTRFNFDEKELSLYAMNDKDSECSDSLDIQEILKGKETIMCMNGSFMIDIINVIQSEFIKISIIDCDSPVLIESSNDEYSKFIIMPMQM